MHITLMLPLLLALVLTSCAGSAPAEESDKVEPRTPEGYGGPAMQARLDERELAVTIEVPTGGFRLELRETARADTHTDVKLRLTAPGEGEAVTQALENKVVRVPLKAESGPIHVHLQQMKRGVEYFVEPEFQLGLIIPR